MSALGHKQTSRDVRVMSALRPKADIAAVEWHVCFVPLADVTLTGIRYVESRSSPAP